MTMMLSDVMTLLLCEIEKLIRQRKTEEDSILYFVPNEELYDKMHEIHIQQSHAGINKMVAHLKKRYVNTTQDDVTYFLSVFEE